MSPKRQRLVISLCLLLSFIAQPLLAMAAPCAMEMADMPAHDMATHALPDNNKMAEGDSGQHAAMAMVADEAMDCCDEAADCSMPGCVVVGLSRELPTLALGQAVRFKSSYRKLYPAGHAASVYRPPISR
jgi:hypothetical protein